MKWLPLLLLLVLPLASAHGEHEGFLKPGQYLDHGKEAGANLQPGEWQNYTLAFGGGPMWAGWFYVVYGESIGETQWILINHNGTNHGETVHQWKWNGPDQVEINQFPDEGVYELQVQNIGTNSASIRWSYDQTCDCTFKPMPFSGSYAWFNPALEKGQQLTLNLTANALVNGTSGAPTSVSFAHATWSGFGRSWDTFSIHKRQAVSLDELQVEHTKYGDNHYAEFHVVAREAGVQYVLIKLETPDDASAILLYSFKTNEEGKGAPPVGLGLVVLGLLMATRPWQTRK